jgi:predicted house-cleaning noncanonical NTP pyrophosphatase (MazG superfamily)
MLDDTELKRIADVMEEILKLVKADQERSKKYMEKEKADEGNFADGR